MRQKKIIHEGHEVSQSMEIFLCAVFVSFVDDFVTQ